MNDMELLESAARAVGIPLEWSSEPDCGPRTTGWKSWNPLTNDGDAMRLAVRLRLDICTEDNDAHPTENRQISHVNVWPFGGGNGASEELGPDPLAATRRAIVRAAAEIGKKDDAPLERAD